MPAAIAGARPTHKFLRCSRAGRPCLASAAAQRTSFAFPVPGDPWWCYEYEPREKTSRPIAKRAHPRGPRRGKGKTLAARKFRMESGAAADRTGARTCMPESSEWARSICRRFRRPGRTERFHRLHVCRVCCFAHRAPAHKPKQQKPQSDTHHSRLHGARERRGLHQVAESAGAHAEPGNVPRVRTVDEPAQQHVGSGCRCDVDGIAFRAVAPSSLRMTG